MFDEKLVRGNAFWGFAENFWNVCSIPEACEGTKYTFNSKNNTFYIEDRKCGVLVDCTIGCPDKRRVHLYAFNDKRLINDLLNILRKAKKLTKDNANRKDRERVIHKEYLIRDFQNFLDQKFLNS